MTLAHDEHYCSSCGEAIKKAAERCPECGVRNDSASTGSGQTIYCESCGEEIKARAEMCPSCGVRHQPASGGSSEFDGGELLYYGQLVLGGFFLLAALGSLSDPETGFLSSLFASSFLGGLGLMLLPPVRERLEKRHPVTTFGWTQSVRDVSVSNPTEACSSCYDEVATGVRREYGSEFVVAGVTLLSRVEGGNMYCQSCLTVESSLDRIESSAPADEPSNEV